MIASGVAIPKHASSNITTVITIPATNPASKPADTALLAGSWLGELKAEDFLATD
jgi:hypothetical protein